MITSKPYEDAAGRSLGLAAHQLVAESVSVY